MAYTQTLLQLRTSLTRRGGFENSADLTSAVLNEFINDAIMQAWEIIVGKWEDYYTTSAAIAVVANTEAYAIPTDFYKLRAVWILFSGSTEYKRLRPGDLDTAAEFTSSSSVNNKNYRYRVMGRNIILMPLPASAETLKVFYIPIATQLTSDSDSITFDVPLEAKLCHHIAYRDCLQRQELPTQEIDATIANLTAMVRTSADSRDAGEPFYLSPFGPPTTEWWDDELY